MILKNANFFLFLLLFSCSPQKSSPAFIDGDDLIPPSPSLMSYFSIHGEDSDQDGVRDDFELYVNETYKDPNYRRGLKYSAKNYGDFMKATNAEEINRLYQENIRASVCNDVLQGLKTSENEDEGIKIQEMLSNNFWRRMHYRKQGRMVKSGLYSWGSGSIMSNLKYCNIKFTDLGKTLKVYVKDNRYKYGMTPEEIEEFETIVGIKPTSKK